MCEIPIPFGIPFGKHIGSSGLVVKEADLSPKVSVMSPPGATKVQLKLPPGHFSDGLKA